MQNTKSNTLIVSNSADELHSVRDLMTAELGEYRTADNETAGLRLFEEGHPSVLILAFDDIELAQGFYLRLFRQSAHIHQSPPRSLLLCKNTEAERAHALCQSGTVDDYMVNRPLYDPFRVRLAIKHAQDMSTLRQQSDAQALQLANVCSDLKQLDYYVGKGLNVAEEQQKKYAQAFRGLNAKLHSQLNNFEARLNDPALADVIKILDKEAMHRQFDELREQGLEPEARELEAELGWVKEWVQEFGDGCRQCIEPIPQDSLPPARREILVVDDDEIYREMLTLVVEEGGMRAIAVEDGEKALAKLHCRRPDLTLMDYEMPGLDGLTTLKKIKCEPDLKIVPVIMLTSARQRDVVEQCIRSGAAGFIVKPSVPSIILDRIQAVLSKPARASS